MEKNISELENILAPLDHSPAETSRESELNGLMDQIALTPKPVKYDSNFKSGFVASLQGQPQMYGQGLQALGDITGIESVSNFGRSIESATKTAPVKLTSWDEIENPGDVVDWLAEQAGQGAGSMATSLAVGLSGAGIGAGAGFVAGGPPGAAVGGAIGGLTFSAADSLTANTGELRQELIAAGVDEKTASRYAVPFGSILSIPDVAVMGKVLSKFGIINTGKDQVRDQIVQHIRDEIAKGNLTSAGKSLAVQTGRDIRDISLAEGVTEMGQTMGQQGVVSYAADKPYLTRENLENVVTAGVSGAFGGAFGGAGGATISVSSRNPTPEQILESGQNEPDASQISTPVPTRDDLAAAMQSPEATLKEPTQPQPQTAQPPPPIVTPEAVAPTAAPSSQGFTVGDTVEHINRFSEVVSGVVQGVQPSDNGNSVTIEDRNGQFITIFDTDGEIEVLAKAAPPVSRSDLEAAMQDAGATLPRADESNTPAQAQPQDLPGSAQAPTPELQNDLTKLQNILKATEFNARQRGWNDSLLARRDEVQAQINALQAQNTPAAEPAKPPTFKDQLPGMNEAQLIEHYTGGHRKRRELAAEELKARFPNSSVLTVLDIADATDKVNPEPTDAQKEAGNYAKGHVSINGMDISIENTKGGTRRGTDRDGTAWEVQMPAHYGYIKRTVGADNENMDVYVGDNPDASEVYVIDQIDADTRDFDEHKAMIGFNSIQEAMDAYNGAFSDGRAAERAGEVTIMTTDEFKGWLKGSTTKKPLLYKKPAPKAPKPMLPPPDMRRNPNAMTQEEAMSSDPDKWKRIIEGFNEEGDAAGAAWAKSVLDRINQWRGAVADADSREATLPQELAGAKPRYNYGDKTFTLNFASDIDLAAYIAAQSGKRSKHDAAYVDFVMKATGMDESAVRQHGQAVRAAIKAMAKDAPSGILSVDKVQDKPPAADASQEGAAAESTDPAEADVAGGGATPNNTVSDEPTQNAEVQGEPEAQNTSPAQPVQQDLLADVPDAPTSNVDVQQPEAKEKPLSKKEKAAQHAEAMSLYYQKGNVVRSYGGNDRVLDYTADPFSVTVEAVKRGPDGNTWETIGQPRNHSTSPKWADVRDYLIRIGRKDLAWGRRPETATVPPSNVSDTNVVETPQAAETTEQPTAETARAETPETSDRQDQATENAQENGARIEDGISLEEAKKMLADIKDIFRQEEALSAFPTFDDRLLKKKEQLEKLIAELEKPVDVQNLDSKKGTPNESSAPRPAKMQDVGEKMDGKRASFTDRMNKAKPSEQAKEIINSTKAKTLFQIEKREGQTEGAARFAQAAVDQFYDFSAYLKMKYIIKSGAGRRSGSKYFGWEQQVTNIFAADGDSDVEVGERATIDSVLAYQYRKDIAQTAEDFVAFGDRFNEVVASADNVTDLKSAFAKAFEDDPNFKAEFNRFSKGWNAARDLFSNDPWSVFGRITDDSAVKKSSKARPMTRPKIEALERVDMKDYRGGRDITAQEFKDTFGFRGVEFGEWVNAKEGQLHVNHAFDALHDMAARLGIKPIDVSLGRKLGFAFGSRGSGEHAAHYEPDTNVINLTKTKGDGSVAHEWLHALDHSLRKNDARSVEIMNMAYNSLAHSVNPIDRIEARIRDFLGSKMWYERHKKDGPIGNARQFITYIERNPLANIVTKTEFSREADRLGKDYWGLGRELLARAWEGFMVDTLHGKSPYLVSDWAAEGVVTKEAGYRGTPYPTGEERQNFNDFFTEFLKLVEFSEDGVKFKEGARLPFELQLEATVSAAKDYLPKLADMMEELQDGNIQRDTLQTGVPESTGGTESSDVSRSAEVAETSGAIERGDGSGQADVRSDSRETSGAGNEGRSQTDRGGDSVRPDDSVLAPVKDAAPEYSAVGSNHKIAVGALDEKRGQKQKAKDNLEIIKTVKKIESEGRDATPEEQALLAKYTGWGSIKDAFPNGEGNIKDGWSDVAKELKAQLDDKEYRDARRSIQYAHYTSEIVVRSMWSALERFGLKSGSIFEPGMGIGNFIGMKPDSINAQYSGIEIDPMTTRIAALLYPQSSVRHVDFISAKYADNMFDAAVGNPPFSSTIIKGDPKYRKDNLNTHNYFFAKTIDMVAPGGVIAFVTSRFSMDAMDTAARKLMAESVDLLGAVRLPDTAFKTNAHTEVVTDIIFMRKRLPGEASNGVKWIETKEIDVLDGEGANHVVNEYFVDNPEMVLGNYAEGSMYSKGSLTVAPVENADLQQQLQEAIARLPENVVSEIVKANTQALDMNPTETKEGSYYLKDGTLMQVEQGIGLPVQTRGKGVTGGITKVQEDKIRTLIPVRNALRETMNAMVERNDAAMKKAQKTLRTSYDAFVKKYGPITKSETESRAATPAQAEDVRDETRADFEAADMEFNEGDINLSRLVGAINPETGKKYTSAQIGRIRQQRREEIEAAGGVVNEGDFDPSTVPDSVTVRYDNLDAFKADPEYYNLMILENYNEDTGEAALTDVFSRNIVAEVKRPEIKTPVDALNYSLLLRNGVDIDFMAQELGMNRDTVIEELEALDLIYALPDPSSGESVYVYSEEYLSGLVKDKLAYAKKLADHDPIYQRNVNSLQAVQPADIPASDINTQLGSPYFSTEVIQDFMKTELNIPARVHFTAVINSYDVVALDASAAENTTTYGVNLPAGGRKSADKIIENLLMRRDQKITYKDAEGKTHVDVPATQAAQDKAKIIQDKFDSWIWKSSHGDKVFRRYNDEYNNIVARKFDGSHITTAISPTINLRPHQKRAVWRVMQTGNTYLAHAVGAGKTLEMAVSAMEMRRLGQWRKPMIVVPNHMLAQFAGEFRAAYPQSRIFVADEQNFHTDRRKRFVANVAKGDWDAVIMTYSSFKKVPVSGSFEAEILEREVDKYRMALADIKAKSGKGITASKVEKQIQKMEERLKGLRSGDTDNSFSFEELGVDAVLLDESHNFRKLSFQTAQGNMKGVNPVGSKASWDLYMKSQYLDTIHPGRYLVLASGTPLTNTLAEVYTIQRYMNERALNIRGIANFDAWSSVYAATVTNPERQPSGAYKNVTRLAEFRNLRSLSQMVGEFMDVVTSEELGALVDRPTMKTGTMIIRTTKPSLEYQAFQKYLEQRTKDVAKIKSNVKGADNILSIIGEGRHAAIDMRLIDPTLPEGDSKLEDMIGNVLSIWKQTGGDQFKMKYKGDDRVSPVKGGTQLIFSDLGMKQKTKDGKSFSAYDHIKRKLLKAGVPAEQIAFIADYDTTEEKRQLQKKVNSGEVRILIGSTAKMGTGLNVQNRLKAVHNLDAPWLPADLEQRVGRALRQGNQYGEIEIYGYGTEASYDSTMWGMLETKAKAIIQFLKGDGDLNSMRDIEETDHFRMAKAMTSGDPRVLKQAELQSDVEKLQRQSKNFRNEQVQIRSDIGSNKNSIAYDKQLIDNCEAAIKKRKIPDREAFSMIVMGQPFTDRTEAGEALEATFAKTIKENVATASDGVKIAEYAGFDVRMFIGKTLGSESGYEVFMDDPALQKYNKTGIVGSGLPNGSGTITTFNNGLHKLDDKIEIAKEDIVASERKIKVLESQIKDKFDKADDLAAKEKELNDIDADLRLNAPVEVIYDEYPISYWEANKASMNAKFSIAADEEFYYRDTTSGRSTLRATPSRSRLERQIREHLKKIGFPEANVVLYDPAVEMPNIAGMNPDVKGAYFRGIIYLAMNHNDIISTLNHEVVHALKAAGAFTPGEWKSLSDNAKAWRKKYNVDQTYEGLGLTDAQLDEEGVAHAIQDRAAKGLVERIRNRITKFIGEIRSFLTGSPNNFTTYDQVFDAIMSGEIAGRTKAKDFLKDKEGNAAPMFKVVMDDDGSEGGMFDGPGVETYVYDSPNSLELSRIEVDYDKQNTGIGTRTMQQIVDYADANNKPIVLTATSEFGSNKKRLMEFYKRFGFVENKGSNKDYSLPQGNMVRYPKNKPMFAKSPATDTEAFKKWFGDSKVVDADGKPMVVYHGTNENFDAFSKDKLGMATNAPSSKHGFFFASDPAVASSYAESPSNILDEIFSEKPFLKAINILTLGGYKAAARIATKAMKIETQISGGNVMPVYISIKNPLVADFKGKAYREESYNSIVGKAKSAGHDGVILKNTFDEGFEAGGDGMTDIYVAFKPEQIKSVNNRGTFDAADDRIMFSLPKEKKAALKAADDALMTVRGYNEEFRESLGKIASYILHPHQIASLYKAFTPVYTTAINMMKSRDKMVHDLTQHIDLYNRINAKSKKKIDAVLEIGRLQGETFKPINGKIVVENKKFQDTHHSKPGEKITLTDVEVDAYLGVRETMDQALDTYKQVILEEYGYLADGIKTSSDLSKALAKEKNINEVKRMQEALKMLNDIDAAKRMGYIPFKRWGQVGISVRSSDSDETLVHFERVEVPRNKLFRKSKIAENRVVEEALLKLREKYPDDKFDITVFEIRDFNDVQANVDLNDLDVLQASSDMSDADYSALRTMLVDSIKRRGFRQHFFKAGDVSGYSPDFERAINDYVVSISSHLSRRMFNERLDQAVENIKDAGQPTLFEYARKYVSYINEPQEEYAAIRQMAFIYYLAGNIASGVTNLAQPVMVTAPWFKAMFTHKQIATEMARAYKDSAKMIDPSKGLDFFDLDKAPDDLKAALKQGNDEGLFLPLATNEAMAISRTNRAYLRGVDRKIRTGQDMLSITFAIPERTNRLVTFATAYRFAIIPENRKKIMSFINRDQLGKQQLMDKEGAAFAAAFAEYAVYSTQFRMGKMNRPTLARGAGTLPFQFMSFVLQSFELMYRLTKVHGEKKGQALGFMLLAVVVMAGHTGFPFEDDLQKLIEALYKKRTGIDLDITSLFRKELTELIGPFWTDAIMEGLPYAALNVDMSGRLGYGNVIPDDAADTWGIWYDMLVQKPAAAADSLSRGNYLQATADIAPAFIKNPIQAYLWSEDGVRSAKTGKVIIEPEFLSASDVWLKAFGFTSGDVSRERARIYAEQRASHAVDDLRGRYYSELARAYADRILMRRAGDDEGADRMNAKIESLNSEISEHNADNEKFKQIDIRQSTLKQRIKQELQGAKSVNVRKQARQESQALEKAYAK